MSTPLGQSSLLNKIYFQVDLYIKKTQRHAIALSQQKIWTIKKKNSDKWLKVAVLRLLLKRPHNFTSHKSNSKSKEW